MEGSDPYSVLGIPVGSERPVARAAFHRLVEIYHPDRLQGLRPEVRAEGERRLREATQAWDAIARIRPRRRPLRAANRPAPIGPGDTPRPAPATLYDAELRSIDTKDPVRVRWAGEGARATLEALARQHRRDRDSVRQLEWGAYQIDLTGAEARRFLDRVVAPTGPDLTRLAATLEPKRHYAITADSL